MDTGLMVKPVAILSAEALKSARTTCPSGLTASKRVPGRARGDTNALGREMLV